MERVVVLIPAFNEEKAISKVIMEIPKELVHEIIVVNNNSTDNTGEVARDAGATVLDQPAKGYGHACMKGIRYVSEHYDENCIIAFLDGDFSDYPSQLTRIVRPIVEEDYDLVVGSRLAGKREKGSMTFPQVFGNRLATFLLNLFFGVKFTDLGPMRAIRVGKLEKLEMKEMMYGWTVEMQLKAAKLKYKIKEAPVDYRKRIGYSKVSGTVKGTALAGYRIIFVILKHL